MSVCAGCGGDMSWARTSSGKWTPVDPDGGPHWATCASVKNFRRPRDAIESKHCAICGRVTMHTVRRSARRVLSRCTVCRRGFDDREVTRTAH